MLKQIVYNNLVSLLKNRNWNLLDKKTKYDVFIPPNNLNFSETYRLYIYNRISNSDFDSGISKNIEILSQIYREDVDELASIIIEDKQILALHIEIESIKNARPSIPLFDNLIHKSKELLQEVANFSILKQAHYFDYKEEAERYLNLCNFFKNDKGSLITKIQLPNNEEIKESTLFESAIIGSQINKNLINIVSFINDDIIKVENFEPNDEFLLKNKSLISVNVTNKLKSLYKSIDLADIDITLKGSETTKTTYAKELNSDKMENLGSFSTIVRERMKEISETNVYGKIIQLKSKDVEADKNTIIVEGMIKNIKSKILLHLNSPEYKLATEAHKTNKFVMINGILEKEKSQYRVIKLKEFKLLTNECYLKIG
ncbi:MAG: hypothetical protein H8E57_10900 [Candidatus Cloacimonetes bacterium]|nr:hypothetical protein [Candidatus Cloacimonadota bacterium]